MSAMGLALREQMRRERTLFDDGLIAATDDLAGSLDQLDAQEQSLADAFDAFHAAHPEVYRALVTLARRLHVRGYQHLGIGMLWETLRYETMLGASPDAAEPFRLNNNHRSRYARLVMSQEPDLAGIFETRALRTEGDQ